MRIKKNCFVCGAFIPNSWGPQMYCKSCKIAHRKEYTRQYRKDHKDYFARKIKEYWTRQKLKRKTIH